MLHSKGLYVILGVRPFGREAKVLGDRQCALHGPAILDYRVFDINLGQSDPL